MSSHCGHWTIVPGNQYMVVMDRERGYHARRKSDPIYNRRKEQLAREFGKRRAAHDRASSRRGHEYENTPPLYREDEHGEEVRRPRRSKQQIEREKAEAEAEKQRLKALFDEGDATFTTLGVIDVNVRPKGKRGRKKKNKKKKGEEEGEEGEEGEERKEKEGKVTRRAGKENIEHPPTPAPRKRRKRAQPTAAVASMEVEISQQQTETSQDARPFATTPALAGSSPLSQATVVRAIVFR
jgi:hypothetical protein